MVTSRMYAFYVFIRACRQVDRLEVVFAAFGGSGEMAASVLALVPVAAEIRAVVSDRYMHACMHTSTDAYMLKSMHLSI